MGKHNLFSWVSNHWGIPNPLNPSIEWQKHQQPGLWAKLLKRSGYSRVDWKWLFPVPGNSLLKGVLDNPLFVNAVATYFTTSKFIVWATK